MHVPSIRGKPPVGVADAMRQPSETLRYFSPAQQLKRRSPAEELKRYSPRAALKGR